MSASSLSMAACSSSSAPASSSRASTTLTVPAFSEVGTHDLLPPHHLVPHALPTGANGTIKAPRLTDTDEGSEPPTPPPKSQTFGLVHKSSMRSNSTLRQPSSSSISLHPGTSQTSATTDACDSQMLKGSVSGSNLRKSRSRTKLCSHNVPLSEGSILPVSSSPDSSGSTPREVGTEDLLPPQDLVPHAPPTGADNIVIAPWLADADEGAEPPTPPPKSQLFGFAHKLSMQSFSSSRHPSASSLSLSARPSEASIHSFATSSDSRDTRRSKGSILGLIKKPRSRSRLRSDILILEEGAPPIPSPSNGSGWTPLKINRRTRQRKKLSALSSDSSLPDIAPDSEIKLDTDLEKMEGIISTAALSQENGSPRSAVFDHTSMSDVSSSHLSLHTTHANIFSDPFSPSSRRAPGTVPYDGRKISPTSRPVELRDESSPAWTAPESWAVVEKGPEERPVAEDSDSDENEPMTSNKSPKRKRRRQPTSSASGRFVYPPEVYKIRIYRANNAYHVVSINLSVTVEELTPMLNKKLLLNPDREPHSLYLKERGRERVLAPTERPANIVRRRLEQAGYDEADGLDMLGAEDLSFLMKFVYKSNVLGPPAEELPLDKFEFIDLIGRSLRTVPVSLYPKADAIVHLNLSRNPMLEIPLDFIQSCTGLRELRLSHMAMKKVPQSIRHCHTLHRLDLSCNRIADLDDAGLDWIPDLRSLKMQNNRLEKLPWYFPRLRALKDLNISNNKFRALPSVVPDITSLVDLDISFNMIDKLPDTIGQLQDLEKLILIGNRVTELPSSVSMLVNLHTLDCRRNHISDLSAVCVLPKVEKVHAGDNAVHALDVAFGPALKELDMSHNDITQLTLVPGPLEQPYALTVLDISHAKLSSLDERALAQLTALETLRLDHNSLRYLPDSIGALALLLHLSCSNNQLRALPATIGQLQKLQILEAHNNSLGELPGTLWNCAKLQLINVTSNLVNSWRLPPVQSVNQTLPAAGCDTAAALPARTVSLADRRESLSSSSPVRALPPLVFSLQRLYLGENRFTDDGLHPFALLQELRVLNLSFNDIQDLPASFFKNLSQLQELYLSGNKLSTLPTEDLHRLTKLEVLFLNGNKLQSLPQEIGKLTNLTVLDAGNNILNYNIFNWQFDWNWNFNTSLQYLNLSGNKRLKIRADIVPLKFDEKRKILADFSGLNQLRVLGLMDITATNGASIPDENEDRRVRISLSEVNGMGYGIADTLGVTEHLNMLDLVMPQFRGRNDEAIFAMFGRASPFGNNHFLNRYLQSHFLEVYTEELKRTVWDRGEDFRDALRRAFLKLNKHLHDYLFQNSSNRKMSSVSTSTSNAALHDIASTRSGASGIVMHLVSKTLYVANAGRSLAVLSRQGTAKLLSKKHDPFDREETARIRSAEGWVSPMGQVNEEIDVARSFGFYMLLPVVNARPYISVQELTEGDEFVIIGNSGLWDHVSYQTAVDIARTERGDPMIAAQKLRDLAISHGAGGTTMIMVIAVADLFKGSSRLRQPTTMELAIDAELNHTSRRRRPIEITDRDISRLEGEVPAPVGHLALVFTDIRNSTHLWEVNAGMPTAMTLHNNLLRRQLRLCGGYEVKTEGDAFMCSFPTAMSALWWCLSVQVQLLHADWPLEILECEDGKAIYDADEKLIARGLSVRMGIHSGSPVCEPDPITSRMDYFGPMVNRAARINGSAGGGQIMCSADIVREINARIQGTGPDTEQSHLQSSQAVEAIRRLGLVVIPVGEVKLKGLEVPEMLSLVYPKELAGRQQLSPAPSESNLSASRVQFSVDQMRELALLCIRLEILSSRNIFSESQDTGSNRTSEYSNYSRYSQYDPKMLLPVMDKASDSDLMFLLDSLATRIENALTRMSLNRFVAVLDHDTSAIDRDFIHQLLAIARP